LPEGDTVHKVAAVLREGLVGRHLTEVQLRGVFQPEQFAAHPIEAVEALGKHLLVTAGPLTLRVHLGMHGSWSREMGVGSRESGADVALSTNELVFKCRKAKDVELFRTKERKRHPALSVLGPDLLGDEPDYAVIVQRARAHPQRPLGEVLLDQKVAAGLGNVYKSELGFLGPEVPGEPFHKPGTGVDPWAPLSRYPDETLTGLYRRGREALLANLGGWHRTTTVDRRQKPQPRGLPAVWVYGREGQPCLRCRSVIRRRAQGDEARSTYWCPRCQTEDGS
jgi:endonuclease-8